MLVCFVRRRQAEAGFAKQLSYKQQISGYQQMELHHEHAVVFWYLASCCLLRPLAELMLPHHMCEPRHRSGAKATDSEDPEAPEIAAQQFGLVRLRGLDDAALPGGRSRLPRAGIGIDLLPAWSFGLRWDYAVESHL